ncbi:MAG: Gfo/Idh/MocA family oxidoreductase, partial [Massilibacteroides sp.]|nr:Gfo/Idh/MocA family oxidoreductase [Massilibacteroides sp.]
MERRDFFKEVGAIGGSGMLISAFPWLQSCTSEVRKETAKEKVNLAVIGTGSRGQYHLFNLQKIPQANVVGLCDIYEPHLQAAKAYFPKAKGYSDYREVLDNPAIKAVVITTPLHLHAPITIAALQAGKQVFCEKAMARTPEDCYKVYQAYKASNQVLYIGMQRLFDAKYIKAMSMIHAGLIGKICGVRAYWFRN